MTGEKRQPPESTRASRALGGLTAAMNMTPEERAERGRRGAAVTNAKRAAAREAAGLPPAKKRAPEPSAAALEPWLEEVDRRWPDREWSSAEARRRQAILLLRMATAEAIAATMRNQNEAGK
jgi:hypothetical protein